MGDGFDVEPEAIRTIGFELRDGLEPLVQTVGQLPEADAGLMTLVIEKAIATLLEGLVGQVTNASRMADDVVRSALHYHWADQDAQADLARLMMPGTTAKEAEAMVADAPGSTWDQVEDEQLGPLRDLFAVDQAPEQTSTGGEHGEGLEGLLLGPMDLPADGDGKGGRDAD